MTDAHRPDPPSLFVGEWVARLAAERPGGRALDLAAGRGRHARLLGQAGFRTFAVDRAFDVISGTARRLHTEGVPLRAWCADVAQVPLPRRWFDLVVVTRYLQRDLCGAIAGTLAPGGALIFETFTEAQRRHGRGPTSSGHLLAAGELKQLFAELDCVFYEEVDVPDAVARLVARASTSRS